MVNTTQSRRRQVEVTWVPVRDRHGRVHMEARWNVPPLERPAAA